MDLAEKLAEMEKTAETLKAQICLMKDAPEFTSTYKADLQLLNMSIARILAYKP